MRRLGDRTVTGSTRTARVIHNFTPYYSTLQVLYLPSGGIEIAHHFADVAVGDQILWGESFAAALTYEVERVLTVPDLQDYWVARCRRVWPTVYVAGERLAPATEFLARDLARLTKD